MSDSKESVAKKAKPSLWHQFVETRVIQTLAIYIPVGWMTLEIVSTATEYFDLPDWVSQLTIVLFFSGIPVAAFLAWVLQRTEKGIAVEVKGWRKYLVSVVSISLLIGVSSALFLALREPLLQERGSALTEAVSVLAVLPFENTDDRSLATSFAFEISSRLAMYPDIYVIDRKATYSPLLAGLMPVTQQEKLQADHRLEGVVQSDESGYELLVSLSDRKNVIWRDVYRLAQDAESQRGLQRRISQQVAKLLGTKYQPSEYCEPTDNLEALEAYHHASFLLDRNSPDNIAEARRLLKKAIELDAGYSQAYSDLAYLYMMNSRFRNGKLAGEIAKKAIDLCPTQGWAYKIWVPNYQGVENHHINQEMQWQDAIAMAPNDYRLLQNYKIHLERLGMMSESKKVGQRASQILPVMVNPRELIDKAYESLEGENWKEALALVDRAQKEGSESCNGWAVKAMAAFRHQSEEGLKTVLHDLPGYCDGVILDTKSVSIVDIYNARSDLTLRKKVLDRVRSDLESEPNYVMLIGIELADFDLSFDAIRTALFQREYLHVPAFWSKGEAFSAFRSDPRFAELMGEMGFVEYWKEYGWPTGNMCSPVGNIISCQ